MHCHVTGGSYNVIFVGVAMLCGEIFTHCIEKNAWQQEDQKLHCFLISKWFGVIFVVNPVSISTDARWHARYSTLFGSNVHFHTLKLFLFEKNDDDERILFLLPTIQLHKYYQLTRIILVIYIQLYSGLLVSVKGGLLLASWGLFFLLYLFCCVYFWEVGDRGGWIYYYTHIVSHTLFSSYIHLVQIYWWLWKGIIVIKEIQDGGVRYNSSDLR